MCSTCTHVHTHTLSASPEDLLSAHLTSYSSKTYKLHEWEGTRQVIDVNISWPRPHGARPDKVVMQERGGKKKPKTKTNSHQFCVDQCHLLLEVEGHRLTFVDMVWIHLRLNLCYCGSLLVNKSCTALYYHYTVRA